MASTTTTPTTEHPVPGTGARLHGKLGTFDIVFTVLAFNAPLSVFIGFIPVIIGAGNQLGAPVAYLAAAALVLVFAVGFTAMSRHLPNPGAFYAYITAGLGRPLGLGSAFLAVVSYFFILVGGYSFGGIAIASFVESTLGGPAIPWWVFVLVLMALAGTLGYFRITLSAKILTVFMIGELILIVAFDSVVFLTGGAEGVTAQPFQLSNIVSGNIGLAALFGIVCFSGFEATAVFREEAKDPARTIPRATYIAVITMGVFYAVSAWAIITGVGAGTVVGESGADPTGTVLGAVTVYLTKLATDVANVLLITSIFAANLSTHNVTTRYLYSLSVDRVLPKALSSVHGHHVSPHVASVVTSIISVLFLTALVIAHADGTTIYAVLVGIGGYSLILLMLMTSAAVVRYFSRHPETGLGRWKTTVSPAIAVVGLLAATALASANIAVMIGGSQALADGLMALFYGCIVLGVIVALIYRKKKPEIYQRIGRQEI